LIFITLLRLVGVLELGILVVQFDEPDDVCKLVLLHADVDVVHFELDVDVLLHWIKPKMAKQLDWLEQVAVTIVLGLGLTNPK